jgi:hypothetical protein
MEAWGRLLRWFGRGGSRGRHYAAVRRIELRAVRQTERPAPGQRSRLNLSGLRGLPQCGVTLGCRFTHGRTAVAKAVPLCEHIFPTQNLWPAGLARQLARTSNERGSSVFGDSFRHPCGDLLVAGVFAQKGRSVAINRGHCFDALCLLGQSHRQTEPQLRGSWAVPRSFVAMVALAGPLMALIFHLIGRRSWRWRLASFAAGFPLGYGLIVLHNLF